MMEERRMRTLQNKAKRSIGIRMKMVLAIIPIVLLVILFFFALSRNAVTREAETALVARSEGYAKDIYA